MLAVEALFDMALLNCRPSAVAAAILYAERRQRGAVPFWPSSLANMTGYEDLTSPELAVAVHTAQKLCRKVLYTQIYRAQATGLATAAAGHQPGVAVAAPQVALHGMHAGVGLGGSVALHPASGNWAQHAQQVQGVQLAAAADYMQQQQQMKGDADNNQLLLESLAMSLSSLGLGGGDLSAAALGAALQQSGQ